MKDNVPTLDREFLTKRRLQVFEDRVVREIFETAGLDRELPGARNCR